MSNLHTNYLFLKTFRNSILTFSIFFLQLTLSLAQDGSDSVRLPPLRNDAEKLAVLLKIKEKVPNLFSDAAQYDIDLFALLEDEKNLLNHLKSNFRYLEHFQQKKYHEIQITPPREGLQVGETSIDPLSIQEWKEQLKTHLNELKLKQKVGNENTPPMEVLQREISAKVRDLAEATSLLDGNALLNDLGKISVNQPILNPALNKKNGVVTLSERLFAALQVYKDLPGKPDPDLQEKLAQALTLEKDRENLKSLIELQSALNLQGNKGGPLHHTWQTAEASLNEVNSENLIAFQDKEDYLRPIVSRVISSSHPQLQKDILDRIYKNISSFAARTISSEKKANEPVTISQQHPIVGIFRGCTGGDCSSQYSFPYPNDPNEKVFFILDKDKKVKGYVSATQVIAHGKPSLYVITVSGNRVTAADTELILRGLEKEKANLGVQQILLPISNNLESLLNFPAPRSVYDRYTAHQPTVAIQYKDPQIRNAIQNYESAQGYNQGEYDHMDRNSQAVVLTFKKNSGNEKITTQIHELPTEPLQVHPLSSVPMSEVFEFLMDLKKSGRQELEQKILQIDHVSQSLNQKKYEDLTHLLSEGQSERPITVQQFRTLITHQLSELDHSLSRYLDKNPSLVYPAILTCVDAFSPENREQIAKYMIKHIKEGNADLFPNHPKWSKLIDEHWVDLNQTETIKKFKESAFHDLKDPNVMVRGKAFYHLGKIKANDPAILSEILQVALHDPNYDSREGAFLTLAMIKPTEQKIHSEISHALRDSDPRIRQIALASLSEIQPTDPKIHLEILKIALNPESDWDMMNTAFNALSKCKPIDPHFYSEIVHFLRYDYQNHFMGVLGLADLISEIRPADPSIYLAIYKIALEGDSFARFHALKVLEDIQSSQPEMSTRLLEVAIHPKDPEEGALAIQALKEMDLSNPFVRENLKNELLKNSNQLNDRQDLLPLIHKMMLPAPLRAKTNETHCQSLNDILSHDKNLKSLMEFFSDHSGALGISRSLSEKIGEDGHPLPTPPLSKKTHVNPPLAPGW